jgi:acyl-CoA thioesterase FadM
MALIAIAEHGRSRWLDATLGVEPETWPYVVVHLELDFRSPATFTHRALRCWFIIERVGTSSVTLRERFAIPGGDVVMEARSVIVSWDEQRSATRSLTEDEATRLSARMRQGTWRPSQPR